MVTIELVPVSDPDCQLLLDEYAAELTGRMAAGFDPARAAPPAPGDFDPPGGVFLLARLDGELAGCGALRTDTPGTGEIRRMYVRPAARRKGVGRALLGALEAAARERGHARVRLDTSEDLKESHALYERAGFRRIPAYNDNPFAARWYEKPLA